MLSKTFIIAVALVITYTLAGFFLVPYLIKRQATRYAQEPLKCVLVMEEVRVNPYALTLEIRDFALKERDGSPILAFRGCFINFEVSTLWHRAWTFAEVRLEGPDVNMEILPGDRMNFTALAERIPRNGGDESSPQQENGEGESALPRILFEKILLNQGRLVFTDRSGETPGSIAIEPIDLELKDLTTLPDRRGDYFFEATLPYGGKVEGSGQASLHPLWSEGRVEVEGFKIASVWAFMQDELLLDKPGGEVGLGMRYRFANGATSPSLVIEGLKVLVSGLELKARGDRAPILSMETVGLNEGRFDLGTRWFSVGDLALSKGHVAASVNAQGQLNWQALVKAGGDSRPSGPSGKGAEGEAWRVTLDAVRLDEVAVAYADRSRGYPLDVSVSKLGVNVKTDFSFSSGKMGVRAENLKILLGGVSMKEEGQDAPLVTLESLAVEGGRLDLDARQVTLDRIKVGGGHAAMVVEKAGGVNLTRLFGGGAAGRIRKEIAEAGEEARAAGLPWNVSVNTVEADGLHVAISDQTLSPATALNLEDITLKLADVHSDGKTPVPFEASLTVREGGALNVRGRFTPAQESAEATVHLSNLALTPFQPYVARYTYLSVDEGELTIEGKVSYGAGENEPNMQFSGNADLTDLLVSELDGTEMFLAWQSLQANDIQLGLGPEQLEIGEVRLIEPYGKLIIYEDRTLNLGKVLRPQEEMAKESSQASQTKERFPVDARSILIEKGHLDFADLSLRPQFATEIHELNGSIVGFSTKEGARAQVQLEGRVDEFGMASIRGEIEPLNAKHFVDIAMLFKNVDMTNLTPYSGKFAGYSIASGKLSLDLHYLIEQSELKGDNQIILDRLTLGEKVESPDAPNIPLELALALLRDADGRIDIGLPVTGNLDDPQFSYGHLIWKALLNLFTKIVTSPFRALGAMFGGEKENLGTIDFEPGRALLLPPEREKVKVLSEALGKRPQLTLKIQGRFDPAADGAALKSMAIRIEIARRTGREVVYGKDPGPVDVSNPLVQKAIEAMFTERISAEALAAAKGKAAKRAADAEKGAKETTENDERTRNETLPPEISRALYIDLLRKLVESHPVTEDHLNELARERASGIKQAFVASGTIDEGRLTVMDPSATEKRDEKTVSSELTLDVRR